MHTTMEEPGHGIDPQMVRRLSEDLVRQIATRDRLRDERTNNPRKERREALARSDEAIQKA